MKKVWALAAMISAILIAGRCLVSSAVTLVFHPQVDADFTDSRLDFPGMSEAEKATMNANANASFDKALHSADPTFWATAAISAVIIIALALGIRRLRPSFRETSPWKMILGVVVMLVPAIIIVPIAVFFLSLIVSGQGLSGFEFGWD